MGNRLEQEVRSQKSEVRIKPALTLTFQAEPVGNPMPLSFPDSEYPRQLWGGPPGPQPTPWPACRRLQVPDSLPKERDEGVPRRPGGPPHQFCRTQPHEDYAALGNPTPQEFA